MPNSDSRIIDPAGKLIPPGSSRFSIEGSSLGMSSGPVGCGGMKFGVHVPEGLFFFEKEG